MPPSNAISSEAQGAQSAPAVSVIIPAYNAAPYIGAALASVFAQTFADFEVIVVNDGSPDTDELERALDPYRERIVYLKQENRGPSGARNAAILKARSEYVALLDSDDVWLPPFLAEQLKALRQDSSLALIYCDALLIGDSILAGRTFMETAPSRGPVTFESLLRYETAIITSCTVARRQSLIDAGLFDEAFLRSEDFDLWLRLSHQGRRLAYQRQVLAHHRMHGESLAADAIKMLKAQIEVLEKIRRTLPLTSAQQALVARQLASCEAQINLENGKRHFVAGEYVQASQALRRANDFYRSRKVQLSLWALRAAPRVLRAAYVARHSFLMRRNTAAMR